MNTPKTGMSYSEASHIGSRSLSDLIVEKLMSDESIGKSISSSISQKMSARRTKVKEKFDPLNIVKFFSGGSALPTVLLGKMMGRSNEDIQHFAGSKKRTRAKDPLYSTINSSSVVPLKRDDGVTDIVTKMYVLLKKSHDRKKKEELSLLKQEKKIRKQSDENLKAMISGLIPKGEGTGAGTDDGKGPFSRILETIKNVGGGVLAAGAGAWAAKKALMRKPKPSIKRAPKPPKVEEPEKPKTKQPEKPKERASEKGTGRATKQKKIPSRGSERFKQNQNQPKPVETKIETETITAEKVAPSSSKISKSLQRAGRVFGAVGLVLLVDEVNELYKKHQSGQISDHDAKNELIKITAGALGGAGGATVGAMLGSLVAPVAGTFIGGVAGGIGGGWFAEDIAKSAIDYFENNEIPTSPQELQRMAKRYVKQNGGDKWGTDQSFAEWFQQNTIEKSRQYVKEHGGDNWGTDMSWGEWSAQQISNIKSYIDKAIAEQLSLTPSTESRYNSVQNENNSLNMSSLNNSTIVNRNSVVNTNVRGSTSTQVSGEQKVRDDSLSKYR